jgi:uncharacterized membrane protein YbaN (DUF454 family)
VPTLSPSPLKRALYVIAGHLFVVIGVLGVVLPVLPGTPFLLLASACYLRGSPRLHAWLHGHRFLGPHLRAFEEGRGLPARVKAIAIAAMWIGITVTTVMLGHLLLALALVAIATGVTIYLVRMPTLR